MSGERFTDNRETDSRMVISDTDDVGEALAEMRSANDRAGQIYEALRTTGMLAARRELVYRCPKCRESVLDVIKVDDGIILGFPRYKTSASLTEQTSSADGRAKNTEDGDRHWRAHAAYLQYDRAPMVSCDDLRVGLEPGCVEEALAAGHAEVFVRPDGSTYVR